MAFKQMFAFISIVFFVGLFSGIILAVEIKRKFLPETFIRELVMEDFKKQDKKNIPKELISEYEELLKTERINHSIREVKEKDH